MMENSCFIRLLLGLKDFWHSAYEGSLTETILGKIQNYLANWSKTSVFYRLFEIFFSEKKLWRQSFTYLVTTRMLKGCFDLIMWTHPYVCRMVAHSKFIQICKQLKLTGTFSCREIIKSSFCVQVCWDFWTSAE